MKKMKKLFAAIATAFTVAILALTLAGCTANVSGKTYVYSEVQMEIPDDADTVTQGLMTVAKGAVEAIYKNAKYTFGEDGKVTGYAVGNWTQDGKVVTVMVGETTTSKFNVNGKKLELGVERDGYSMTVIFVEQ